MTVATDKRLLAEVAEQLNVQNLAMFLTLPGHHYTLFKVQFPEGVKRLKVEVTSIRKRLGSVMPFVIGGTIVEANGREWESFNAYFEMTANYCLSGSCTIGEFPEGQIP